MPVLDRDLDELALELAEDLLGGGVGGLLLLRGRGPALRGCPRRAWPAARAAALAPPIWPCSACWIPATLR